MWGPKRSDQDFFAAFSRHAAVTSRAAGRLVDLFQHPGRSDLADQIEEDEHEGDKIVHETANALRATWITPFDRGEIQNLISRLDDVLDLIHATAKRVVLFEIQVAPDDALTLAQHILRGTETMRQGVNLINNMKQSEEILRLCEALNEIENEGDEVYRQSLARLYKPGRDPLEAMKWREIYERLENALDRCEDVADQLESLVVEYS